MVRHTLEILQQMQQQFQSVTDHFGKLCSEGLKKSSAKTQYIWMLCTSIMQDTRQAKKIYEKTSVMKFMSSRDAYQFKLVKLFGPSPNIKMQ